jgi:hypothetical protein
MDETMCQTIFLLSDRKLPVPLDETVYPDLKLYLVESEWGTATLAGIQRIASSAFVYGVSAGDLCGCYFNYETSQEHSEQMAERAANVGVEYANTPEQAEKMWQSQVNGVKSFGRYLAGHADASLAVYVVWEGCAGQKEPMRASVPPSYFGGPGFERLPEDIFFTVTREPSVGEILPWDLTAPRTHQWLTLG